MIVETVDPFHFLTTAASVKNRLPDGSTATNWTLVKPDTTVLTCPDDAVHFLIEVGSAINRLPAASTAIPHGPVRPLEISVDTVPAGVIFLMVRAATK